MVRAGNRAPHGDPEEEPQGVPPVSPLPEVEGPAPTPANRQSTPAKLSCLAYSGYYLLLFFAYWFGAHRFDADGDGDFDPEDVQLFLSDIGVVSKNFANKKRRKKKKGEAAGQRPQTPPRRPAPQVEKARGGEDGPPPAEGEGGRPSALSFDQNGDGEVNFDDIAEAHVEGEGVEEYVMKQQRIPFFILLQSILAFLLWFGGSISVSNNTQSSFLTNKAGIDTFSPGWSDLRLFGPECQDYRGQVWRWFTYQWTHVGIAHILMNCVMNLVLGIPLEGLHGPLRMILMYNIGVFGGACCYWVGDAHKQVVGMSGGCYALIGMHVADLVINWAQLKFRKPMILFLAVMITVDVLSYVLALGDANASHTAHVGGAIAGLIIGVLIGRNLVVKKCERIVQAIFGGIGAILLAGAIIWMATSPAPRNITESQGWCWVRQVYNPARFNSTTWICVKCNQECMEDLITEKNIETVALSACTTFWEWDG